MALSTTVKVKRDGSVKLEDGAGIAVYATYTDGDFSASNFGATDDRVVIRSRGDIVGLRRGDSTVGSLSMNLHFREFTNTGADSILDFIRGKQAHGGGLIDLTSTGGTGFEQFLCTVTLTVEGTDHGENADGTAVFAKVLFTADFSEGDPNSISLSGEVYGGVTFTGQT